MTEPPRQPPEPANMGAEVAALLDVLVPANPTVPMQTIREYARRVVVCGRTVVEEIRQHGRLIR